MDTTANDTAVWAYSNTGNLAHFFTQPTPDSRLVAACRSTITREKNALLYDAEDISGRLCKPCETHWNAHLARVERSMQPLQPYESVEVYGAAPEQPVHTFAVGDRIRTTMDIGGSWDGALVIPAGSTGVIQELSTTGETYEVLFDGDLIFGGEDEEIPSWVPVKFLEPAAAPKVAEQTGPESDMGLTHLRTENGTRALITRQQAADEIDSAISGPTRKDVHQMSASKHGANLHYRDGRIVDIRPATLEDVEALTAKRVEEQPETTADGNRIVTVKGKRYVVSDVRYSQTATSPACVDYWSERNGRAFGPTRWAGTEHAHKTGTVAAAIWAEVTR